MSFLHTASNETKGKNATKIIQPQFPLPDDFPEFLLKELPISYNIVGCLFNILLIVYFLRSKKYKTPIFTLLTSLAVTDLVCCISGAGYAGLVFPIMTVPNTGFMCHIILGSSIIGLIGSEYHLVFFAGLRLYQLAFPLLARARITSNFVLKGCVLIFILVIGYALVIGILFKPMELPYHGEAVTMCIFTGNEYLKNITYTIISTYIPCSAIALLHLAKYIAVWRNSAKLSLVSEQERKNTDLKAVAIVIVLFYIAWITPTMYVEIQQKRDPDFTMAGDRMYLALTHFAFSNSTLNPLVYCVAAKSARDDIIKRLCPVRKT